MIHGFVRTAWVFSTLTRARAFAHALQDPVSAQQDTLRRILSGSAPCEFLGEHGVGADCDIGEFRRRVPVRTWEELRPWLNAVVTGGGAVLTRDPVRRLVPTSGTSGGRKLVPSGAGLLEDFRRALDPWVWDLHAGDPKLLAGPAYWAISPPGEFAAEWKAAHPIGFEDDASYFGPLARLAEATRPVPSAVGKIADADDFRQATLLHLLRSRGLAFVSVWHPSFLELLLDHLEARWDDLLRDLRVGRTWEVPDPRSRSPFVPPDPRLARRLAPLGPDPRRLWPGLRQVSAWTDGASASPACRLEGRLGGIPLVGKGLLATEGVASIPWKGRRPLAVRSHFLEFVDPSGAVGGIEDLAIGGKYELVLTTSGGLWRMRTGDLVEVDGMCEATPCIRFLGRVSGVVDLVGEKLDEVSVVAALEVLLPHGEFALVVPRRDGEGYRLLIESDRPDLERLAPELDRRLRSNPHYDLARRLGQLSGIEVAPLAEGSRERMAALWSKISGASWSVSKPPVLLASHDWADRLGADS